MLARARVLLGTEGATSLSSVSTLCNTALGAGVLGLPYAFARAGLVGCLLLSLSVAALEAFTMYVLAKFAERYDAPSYGTLIRRALGRKTGGVLSGVMVLYLWGSSVAYLVVVSDTFTSLSTMLLGPTAWCSHRVALLAAFGLVLLPLCFPRNLSAMEYVSAASVVAFLYCCVAVSVRGFQAVAARPDPWAGISLIKLDAGALYALPLVIFGYNCHANVVSVFVELEHRPSRLIPGLPASPREYYDLGRLAPKPSTYKLIGMLGAIIVYMLIIFLGYSSVGISGYLAYPTSVSSNVLNSFPAGDIARAAIGCVCVGSYPLNHHPARAAWEDLFDALADVRQLPKWLSVSLTTLFVASTVGTAMLVTDLGSVLHIVGGTAAAFMVFMLPGLLLMNAAIIKHTTTSGPAVGSGLSDLADVEEDGELGDDSSGSGADRQQHQQQQQQRQRGAAAAEDSSAPLLDTVSLSKKAGFRDAGFIFAPRKGWWAGLGLVAVSLAVMTITVLTTE
ncbi:AAAP family transporter: amino acid [Monoraphidium neglectum]|uniref:AAAP family transporter: amino acid n=1 Tax=Monoraphidium neglectum TaxID=145388 RepID=A0A0D2MZS3_9CHLO|nr:AAAP family transporter: amino acid [Monoraphidium neglectum]KIY99600.1 AAAP family transporter: amino acid [Monoraphidium neglectum]|eukprot:XP_013898620.1 AAAP family transporter: amino acid [Monoraphidium neglectum]